MGSRARIAAIGAVLVALVGGGLAYALWPEAESGPYVVSAIDYHFHDAHPSAALAPGRTLIVKNVGRNVHNVTFEGLGYSRDVKPGEQLAIRDVATFLGGPGRYPFVCKYHADRGMDGVIVVVD